MSTTDGRIWVALACSIAAFVLLGYRVARGPARWPDSLAPLLFGRMTALATLFTITGYARVIATVAALAVIVALIEHALLPATVIILVQILSQLVVVAIKEVFNRSRPEKWLYRQEPGSSYPSGHATTAIVFYGTWLILIAESNLPATLKAFAVTILAIWIAGICWSRVALGAHYPTDVLGGTLIGAAFLSGELAFLSRFHLA